MLLKKIILNNIRSYKNQKIEFSEGSTLLSGDIGSGKTSILLGIEFALFGLQPGQRGASLLRNGESEGGVVMEFEVDGNEVKVERTLKKAKTISQNYSAITLNGEKREISVSELKSKILELLSYPTEFSKKQNILYKFTVYTPQEEMKQIILQDSETRINTLRHVFGIDKYKKILENISILSSKLREEKRLKEGMTLNLEQDKLEIVAKETDLESKKINLGSIEKEVFLKTEARKRVQEEREEVVGKIEEKKKVEQEMEKTKMMVSHKRESVINNSKSITELNIQIEELGKIEIDESKVLQYERNIQTLNREKKVLEEKRTDLSSAISSINLKKAENARLEGKISNLDICPTCLQNVDAIYRTNVLNKLRTEIVEGNKKILELDRERNTILEKITKTEREISVNEKLIQDLRIQKIKYQGREEKQTRLNELQKSNELLEKDMALLSKQVETLNQMAFELGRYEGIYQEKQKLLDAALQEEKIAEMKVVELKKEMEVFSIQIRELKDKVERVEEIKGKLDYIIKLENWLSKNFAPVISFIEKNVMIKLKSEFSTLFAEWFSMLVSDNFNVHLDDNFTPIVEQQDYVIDYNYLSGGERTAIALAYRLSLNQVINSLLSKIKTRDFVILDEPTDGFSDQQLDKMRNVLDQLNVAQLIIVSHEQKIEGFVENVIRFKKKNGVSVRV